MKWSAMVDGVAIELERRRWRCAVSSCVAGPPAVFAGDHAERRAIWYLWNKKEAPNVTPTWVECVSHVRRVTLGEGVHPKE
jgi:hypothetical protein